VRTPSSTGHAPASEAPAPEAPAPKTRAPEARGRHRRTATVWTTAAVTVNVLAHAGSLVTLAALLVLAATAGGLADGMPAGAAPTVTATYER